MKKFSQRILFLAVCALAIGAAWSVAQPQSPPSAPVTVVNQSTNPVPVTGIVSVTRNIVPVRLYDNQTVEPGNTVARFSEFYTVPAGKRLIVEHISCSFAVYAPDAVSCGIEEALRELSTSSVSTPVGTGQFGVHSSGGVRVIFGPGESFNAIVNWEAAQPGRPGAFFALSGYLEDDQ